MSMLLTGAGQAASDGPPPFDPSQIPGLVLWLDARSLAGLDDGDPIETWPDLSAEEAAATQPTIASRPTYVAESPAVNGSPAAVFDGVDDFIGGLGDFAGENLTVFAVFSLGSATAAFARVVAFAPAAGSDYGSGAAGLPGVLIDSTGPQGGVYYSGSLRTSHADLENGMKIFSAVKSSSGIRSFVNGADEKTSAATGTLASERYRVGADLGETTNAFLLGAVSSILVYVAALTDEQRQQVEQWLAAEWPLP